ncbi:MAG: hypothetical protein AAGF59_04450 [Pseudomonadota bacterium]
MKFSTQAAPNLLSTMRSIAREEGRQFQAVLEEAMTLYIERKRGDRARRHVLEHLRASISQNHELYQKQTP